MDAVELLGFTFESDHFRYHYHHINAAADLIVTIDSYAVRHHNESHFATFKLLVSTERETYCYRAECSCGDTYTGYDSLEAVHDYFVRYDVSSLQRILADLEGRK